MKSRPRPLKWLPSRLQMEHIRVLKKSKERIVIQKEVGEMCGKRSG
jgi:hypothetical protein